MQHPKPTIVFVADRIRLSVYAARSNVAPESLAITIERNQSGSDTGWYPTATLRGDDLHAMAKALHELMLTLSTSNNGKGPVLGELKRPLAVSKNVEESTKDDTLSQENPTLSGRASNGNGGTEAGGVAIGTHATTKAVHSAELPTCVAPKRSGREPNGRTAASIKRRLCGSRAKTR